ncbi:tripartite tricarboxylate transporter permease [Bengtsoniella intestinalis]|uniref:tripartite tricarboxylate transporter permease n=1 Tax=Bengtsoniella intestinalis TaxID=3073143 RepID=UPI00391F930A
MSSELLAGFAFVLQPMPFLYMLFGVVEGIVIGALPGLSGSIGIILVLPLVYTMDSQMALVMLCGIFCGSMFGGSVSAILLNTPGTPAAAATLLDGYPLAKKGEAGKAIGTAAIGSFIGGLISSVCLMMISPQLSKIALQFNGADYFSLAIFGLTLIAASSGKNVGRGLLSGLFGAFLGTFGTDPILGSSRFTFGSHYLMNGFSLLPVLIGVFAVSEVFAQVLSKDTTNVYAEKKTVSRMIPTMAELKDIFKVSGMGGVVGVLIGIIPGTGGSISCFLAYNLSKKMSKHPELYGEGSLEGIAACESSNNGTTGGALIPMLTLGVPGDVITSVMLGALVLIGVTPGPMLFTSSPEIVYSIFAGMFVIQFLMLGVGLLFARVAHYVLRVPTNVMMPVILVLCVAGTYSIANQIYHVAVAFAFGIIGLLMKKFHFPGAPMILGLILGPMAETNLNRALQVSKNDWTILFTRPISCAFLIVAVLSVVLQTRSLMKERKAKMEEQKA